MRTVRVLYLGQSPDTPLVMVLNDGKRDALYTVSELPAPGPAFRLFEVIGVRPKDAGSPEAARRYHSLVREPEAGQPARGDCTCAGGVYRGSYHACRHLSALSELWSNGTI